MAAFSRKDSELKFMTGTSHRDTVIYKRPLQVSVRAAEKDSARGAEGPLHGVNNPLRRVEDSFHGAEQLLRGVGGSLVGEDKSLTGVSDRLLAEVHSLPGKMPFLA